MEALGEAFVAFLELTALVVELIINSVIFLIDFTLRCVSSRYRAAVDPPGPLFSSRLNKRGRKVNRRGMPLWIEGGLAAVICLVVVGGLGWYFWSTDRTADQIAATRSQVETLAKERKRVKDVPEAGFVELVEEDVWGTALRMGTKTSLKIGVTVVVRSAGPDTTFDTIDDIVGEHFVPIDPKAKAGDLMREFWHALRNKKKEEVDSPALDEDNQQPMP